MDQLADRRDGWRALIFRVDGKHNGTGHHWINDFDSPNLGLRRLFLNGRRGKDRIRFSFHDHIDDRRKGVDFELDVQHTIVLATTSATERLTLLLRIRTASGQAMQVGERYRIFERRFTRRHHQAFTQLDDPWRPRRFGTRRRQAGSLARQIAATALSQCRGRRVGKQDVRIVWAMLAGNACYEPALSVTAA